MSNEEQNLWCDHAALQLNTNPFYVPLTDKTKGEITNQSLILTIDSNTTLEAGQGKFVADVRFAKKDWSSYDTLTNPIVKVYYDGQLVQ